MNPSAPKANIVLIVLLLLLLGIMELLSFVDGGKKVYVTRTVKKTIRRIPGDGGVPTERHSVRTAHYTRNENGELVETSDGGPNAGGGGINTGGSGSSSNTVVLRDDASNYRKSSAKGGHRKGDRIEIENNEEESEASQMSDGGRKKSGQRRAGGNGYTDEEESDASLMMSQGGRKKSGGPRKGNGYTDEEETDDWQKRQWEDSDGSRACDSGDWHQYNGYCYKLLTGSYTWDEAKAACSKEGGSKLVSIHSKIENEFVAALTSHFATNFDKFCDGFWIGMTRKQIPGSDMFKSEWIDKTPVNFGDVPKATVFHHPPYRGGQPDSPKHGVEECIQMYPKLGCDSHPQIYYGEWNDFYCTAKLNGAVCKKRG